MLLDSKYTIIPSIRFTLTYDNNVRKVITVKTRDIIDCTYKRNGERFFINGVVTKIGCNFNSSLGAVGTTAYLQIDGSAEYAGQVEYIQPSQILDLTVVETTNVVENIVCSVDNRDQKVTLIRENEVGVFQYSLDGLTWHSAVGSQGMSAYECAVALGFEGSEEEWLRSLKGEQGDPGEPGALEIFRIFNSLEEAEENKQSVPKGKLITVISEPSSILYVRIDDRHHHCNCHCHHNHHHRPGYIKVGYLSVGPQGEQGIPGKSAYQYAIEGGFIGSEEDFKEVLARSSVAVTNFYMGSTGKELEDTVIGPIDLRIFGHTNPETFVSKTIERIDISSPTETENQTLIFPKPIILRAIPTDREAAKPNLTINNQKYIADCIMKKDGVIGVYRRIKYFESYNGETILGDWLSSSGELDLGAQVQCVGYGKFEPFDERVQSQYKKLHTYDNITIIDTTESAYMSISYPINITAYVNKLIGEDIGNTIEQYINEHGPEIIQPIVETEVSEALNTKQDKLIAGNNITIQNNVISATGGGTTVLEDSITVGQNIGGYSAGDVIPAGTELTSIIQTMLASAPVPPPGTNMVYFGVTENIPNDLSELTGEQYDDDVVLAGITHSYTVPTDTLRYLVYAYKKSLGNLKKIIDQNGFVLSDWEKIEYEDYYIYHTSENKGDDVEDFELTFTY